MPKINLAGVPDSGVETLPNTILFGTFIVPFVPGLDGATETDIGGGLTRVSAPFAGATIEVVVKNYASALRGPAGDERVMISEGVIESVQIVGDRVQKATDLGIVVADFLPVIDAFIDDSNPDLLPDAVFGLGWTILGRKAADVLSWDPVSVGIDAKALFAGNDTFNGKGGGDTISLFNGNDKGIGGSGDDTIRGGAGNDTLKGGKGNDDLFGDQGRDTLLGGGGNDVLSGGQGGDVLKGGNGRDKIRGGAGDDRIDGGGGNDKIYGNAGSDHLQFGKNAGADKVFGFDPAVDHVELKGVHGIELVETANGVHVVHDGGTVDLLGLTLADIDSGDILGW